MKKLLAKIRKILHDRRTRRFLTRMVSGVAALVVFVTTYALVLPAITMEKEANCGIEAHQHDDSCYTEELICDIPESDGHHHDESCYNTTSALVCGMEEHEHTVENGCYDDDGNLICEIKEHKHADACYEEIRELTCEIPESDGHHHTEACFEKVLTCGREVHIHSTACYEEDPVSDAAVAASTSSAAAASTNSSAMAGTGAGSVSSAGMTLSFEGETAGSNDNDGMSDNDGSSDNDGAIDNAGAETTDTAGGSASTGISKTEDIAEVTYGSENATAGNTEASNTALTNADNSAAALTGPEAADQYIPALDAINFNTVLNKHTGIYYHPVAVGETVEDSSAIPAQEWIRIPNNTEDAGQMDDTDESELGSNDLLRVYLSYTIPAGSLNRTNPVARYRLPSSLHLTDPQVKAINENVNGIAGQYVDMSTLEIKDLEKYNAALGIEAVEGTRRVDESVEDYLEEQARRTGTDTVDAAEYISAIARVENVYDTDGIYGEKDAYLGQDLIFTFTPYSVEKNQHEYDAAGQPTKAGEKIEGWLTLDLNMGQVDFEEPEITTFTEEASATENENIDGESDQLEGETTDSATETSATGNEISDSKSGQVEGETTDSAAETSATGNENTDSKSGQMEEGETTDPAAETSATGNEDTDTESNQIEENNEDDNIEKSHAGTIERTKRTADIVFVEEGWDENNKKIDQISTTLTIIEETVVDTQDNDTQENDTQDEDTSDDAADSSVNDKAETTEEDRKAALTEDTSKEEPAKVPAEIEQIIMPAMSFNDSIRVTTGKPAGIDENAGRTLADAADSLPEEAEVSVRVEADEGTFPAGTTMVLKAVTEEDMAALAKTVTDTVEKGSTDSTEDSDSNAVDRTEDKGDLQNKDSDNKNNEKTNLKTYGFQAVDITFLDKDGNEIEPAKPVRVAMTSKIVEQVKQEAGNDRNSMIAEPVVVHVDDNGSAEQMDLVAPEDVEPAKGKTEEELLKETAADSAESAPEKTDTGNSKDSKDIDTSLNDAEDADAVSNDTEDVDAVSNDSEEADTAEQGKQKEDVQKDDEPTDESAAEAAVGDNSTPVINQLTPEEKDADDDRQPAAESDETGGAGDTAGTGSTVEFEAEAFSIYAIVYTVDFHWEVNGKKYEFSIPGGGFVSFMNLVEVLDISDAEADEGLSEEISEDANVKVDNADSIHIEKAPLIFDDVEVSEDTRKFVSDVESITFSEPSLLSVSKVEVNTTVGAIKDELGLECDYSAEITNEQIAEINAQQVENGDWALISLKAFETEEQLIVTMKTGEVWSIKVTDARVQGNLNRKYYIIRSQTNPNLAVAAPGFTSNGKDYLSADDYSNETNSQKWYFEYDWQYGGVYRIKSVSEDKYLNLDGDSITYTTDSFSSTLFYIDLSNGRYTISTGPYNTNDEKFVNLYNGAITVTSRGEINSGNGHFTQFTFEETTPVMPPKGVDWILYLDEADGREITIHVGDTITLRPYDEWKWKEGDIQSKYWNIPLHNSSLNWTINNNDGNHSREYTWTDEEFDFKRFVKLDSELNTKYWSVQGTAREVGQYTLKTSTGGTLIVNIEPGVSAKQPNVITKTSNIKVNLFDYDLSQNLDDVNDNNKANQTNHNNESINYNTGFDFLSSGGGNTSGHYGSSYSNDQFDVNDYTGDRPHTGLVESNLTTSGYPKVNYKGTQATATVKELDYLFDTSQTTWTSNGGMIAYPNVNGLFQKDSDNYYYYNSNVNYAYYNPANGNKTVTLYEHTYTQVSKDNNEVNAKPIGFFPYHEYDSTAEKLYVNQNQELNHHLGMSMEFDFILLDELVNDSTNPIKFDFSGDDDLWVFIDGKLAMDIGGIHQPVTGTIDFTNKNVTVAGKTQKNSSDSFWNSLYDGQPHTMKVFYLERGGCDSNLSIRFNLSVTGLGDLDFKKTETNNTSASVAGAVFGLFNNSECTGDPIYTVESDNNGIVLEEIPNATYYMKEIKAPEGYRLNETVYEVVIGERARREPTTIKVYGSESAIASPVLIENEPTKLIVKKEWIGSDSAEIAGMNPVYFKLYQRVVGSTSVVELTNLPGYENNGYVLKQDNNWKQEFARLPKENNGIRFEYYVVEQGSIDNYRITYKVGDDAEVSSGANAALQGNDGTLLIRNIPTTGALKITKIVTVNNAEPADINASLTNGTYEFDIVGITGSVTANINHKVKITFSNGKAVSFQLDNGEVTNVSGSDNTWSVIVKNLKPGDYKITEASSSDLIFKSVTGGNGQAETTPRSIRVTVTEAKILENDLLDTAKCVFTNNIGISDITIKKVDINDVDTTLFNAVFQMFKKNSSGTYEVFENEGFDITGSGTGSKHNGPFTVTNGIVTISKLIEGSYLLQEKTSPLGYVITNEDTYFTVGSDGTVSLTDANGTSLDTISTSMALLDNKTLSIKNEPGTALPNTGGSGANLIYILGIMLTGLASIGFLMNRRKTLSNRKK